MKKVIPVLLVLTLLLTACLTLAACSDKEPTIDRYYIQYPLKADKETRYEEYTYKSGTTWADTNIVIAAVMSDGTETTVKSENVGNRDYTKIVYSAEMKALLDDDNKFKDVTTETTVTLTVAYLDAPVMTVAVTVKPKA